MLVWIQAMYKLPAGVQLAPQGVFLAGFCFLRLEDGDHRIIFSCRGPDGSMYGSDKIVDRCASACHLLQPTHCSMRAGHHTHSLTQGRGQLLCAQVVCGVRQAHRKPLWVGGV